MVFIQCVWLLSKYQICAINVKTLISHLLAVVQGLIHPHGTPAPKQHHEIQWFYPITWYRTQRYKFDVK